MLTVMSLRYTSESRGHVTQAASDPLLPSADQLDAGAQFLSGSFDDLWNFGSFDCSFDLDDWSDFSRTSPWGVPAFLGPML